MPFVLLVDRNADTRHMYAKFERQPTCGTDEAKCVGLDEAKSVWRLSRRR